MGWPRGVPRKPKIKQENVMSENDEKKVELTPKQMQDMINSMNNMQSQLDSMSVGWAKDKKMIEELQKAQKNKGIETTFERMAKKSPSEKYAEPQKDVKIVDEPGEIDQRMKHDCCPWCVKFNPGKSHILDQMPTTGKYACRLCGKHWVNEAWETGIDGEPRTYSLELERGQLDKLEEKERIKLARKERIMVER